VSSNLTRIIITWYKWSTTANSRRHCFVYHF